MEEPVELLKQILSIPSVNGRDDEGKVAEYLQKVFLENGILARIQRIDETHANVIAVLEGENPSKIMVWNGHLDTVPYGNRKEWDTDPAVPEEKEGYFYARGASDMKSGLAAMVSALCRFQASGKKPSHTLLFLGTCDEEKNGLGALKALEEFSMSEVSGLLIGEPTGCRLGIAQKGCLWLEIQINGKTSHGAYPAEGCNAVERGYFLALKLGEYVKNFSHPVLQHSTAQVTQISGGVAPNMTPDECRILMDIRMVPGLTKKMVLGQAEEIAKAEEEKYGPALKYRFEVKNDRRAIEISSHHEMTKKLVHAIRKQNLPEEYIGINYFTDASILARDFTETGVILFGPGEPGMAHKPNERVKIENYLKAIEVLIEMIP